VNGVAFGLDPGVVSDGREWHVVLVPGMCVVDGVATWDLGHDLTEVLGNVGDELADRELRHPRDGIYPVLAGDNSGPVRLVGAITVTTVATLVQEGSYAVTYLEDLAPYKSIVFTLPTGATAAPVTIQHNRCRFDSSMVGLTLDIDYTLGSCIAHNGLSAVTIVGPLTNLWLRYRTDIPMASTGDSWYVDHRFTGWTSTGVLVTPVTGSLDRWTSTAIATQQYGVLSTSVIQDSYRKYLLCSDFLLEAGDLRIDVEGFTGYHTAELGRNTAIIPCEGTSLTINVTMGATGSSVTWYGSYLVQSIDEQNRRWVGAPIQQCYVSSTPYATIPLAIYTEANTPCRAGFGAYTTTAPTWVRASLYGSVDGVTVPYVGAVAATIDDGSPAALAAIESKAPGEYWFECATLSAATLSIYAGAVLATVVLPEVDLYSGMTYSFWLDVVSGKDGKSHTIKPVLLTGDGMYRTISPLSLCTITVVDGSFAGSLATTSLVSINSKAVLNGGSYVYGELLIGADLYLTPRVRLPHYGESLLAAVLPTTTDVPI